MSVQSNAPSLRQILGTARRVTRRPAPLPLALRLARPWGRFLAGRAGSAGASALMIRSGLGTGAWDSVNVGLHDLTRAGIGTISVVVSLTLCVVARLLGVRPTAITVATAVIGGVALNLILPIVPPAPSAWLGGGYYLLALAISGLSSALYLSARLGHTAYDGVVRGLRGRHGWGEGSTRTAMELPALTLAWLCGGPIGLGTLICTVAGGPAVATGMKILRRY